MDLFTPTHTPVNPFQEIKDGLHRLYVEDPRPWLVGFSGVYASASNGERLVQTCWPRVSPALCA